MKRSRGKPVDGVLSFNSRPYLHWHPSKDPDALNRLIEVYAKPAEPQNWKLRDFEMRILSELTGMPNLNILAISSSGSDANNLLFDVTMRHNRIKYRVAVGRGMWVAQRGLFSVLSGVSGIRNSSMSENYPIMHVCLPYVKAIKSCEHMWQHPESQVLSKTEKKALVDIEIVIKEHRVGNVMISLLRYDFQVCLTGCLCSRPAILVQCKQNPSLC
jgi:hypothetical protein